MTDSIADLHIDHNISPDDATYISNNKILGTAENYTVIREFRADHPSLYQLAYQRGILTKVVCHMERGRKWTRIAIANEARNYTTRSEFASSSPSAYQAAKRLRILTTVCAHMTAQRSTLPYETEADIWAIVDICKSYSGFTSRKRAYRRADELGLLPTIYAKLTSNAAMHLDAELEDSCNAHSIDQSRIK